MAGSSASRSYGGNYAALSKDIRYVCPQQGGEDNHGEFDKGNPAGRQRAQRGFRHFS